MAGAEPPLRRGVPGDSLTALRKAVSAQPTPAEYDANKDAFPLEEEFKEF